VSIVAAGMADAAVAADTEGARAAVEAAAQAEEGVPPSAGATVDDAGSAQLAPDPEPAAAAVATTPAGLESTVSSGHRTAILEELLAMSKEYMSKFDSYKLLSEDPSRELQARTCTFRDTALPVTLVRLRADGFTMDHVRVVPVPFANSRAVSRTLALTRAPCARRSPNSTVISMRPSRLWSRRWS
jgi:hypothetical protein